MVIKTDTCSFSEFKIFPGHGSRFVRKDGQLHYFISSKCKSLFHQRKKPARLTWTMAWRRLNKKNKSEEVRKRRGRKTTKVIRAVVGVTAEEIRRRKTQKPEARRAAREAALREIKSRKKNPNVHKKGKHFDRAVHMRS
mmetsp:Transcript_24358/g.78254  ORF Transcript_24358/g.78254 Transcript_24358/m.78254 type:complete len:139 (-) Transcript_24358:95-511(-)|eukprot:CAMPEP_0196780854 /NCGR_PEP_ID=MMETSP1104-20130614/8664_1 /TAXON_ID=33652 /ORGANISM="Cafeteria sp., Strain Caron Lab Isolate" /LENGTH=138 /DNA_ID=CAMNT_0042151069 /DNA_START=40 /DNA_END=456 /DNA_ORIENTATION=+